MDRTRPAAAHPGAGLKLLIVDDDPHHAEVVADCLERVGYECAFATTSAQAGEACFLMGAALKPELPLCRQAG